MTNGRKFILDFVDDRGKTAALQGRGAVVGAHCPA
jgi:hypothetical protein